MLLSAIAAMDLGYVIGQGNALPWHLPADLKRFRALTIGKPVVMGRRTYESMGRPLRHRTNIVLSRREGYAPAGCLVAASLDAALKLASGAPEVMLLGGAEVYAQALGRCDRIYLSIVAQRFEGDAYFPRNAPGEWQVGAHEFCPVDASNHYAHGFFAIERVPGT